MDDAALSVWLRLREQRDWKARSVALTEAIVATLPDDRPVGVLDLATGAGSNLRYLVQRLPTHQRWLLIDRSAALLSEAETRTRAWAAERGYAVHPSNEGGVGFSAADASAEAISPAAQGFSIAARHLDCHVEMRVQNLGTLDDSSMFAGRHLVTASALLDLVSEAWLRRLTSRCRSAGASALLTITYDGRASCDPAEPEDELVRGLMNTHQRRDKGLGGPAEGPNAASCAARCFADAGYEVKIEESDWVLDPGDSAMQRTLIDGWARAASEQAPGAVERIASWRQRRLAHVDAGVSHLVVGHRDVAAWRE
jgi:hypothetical protein